MGKLFSVIQGVIADLEDGKASCVMGCDLLFLGSVVKALHQWKLSEPFDGVSFEAVTDSLRELQNQVWYIGAHQPRSPKTAQTTSVSRRAAGQEALKERFAAHYCGIRSLINPKIYSLDIAVDGLDLNENLGG